MRYAFYFDQSKCIACNACTVSCKDYNQVNPGLVRWRKQETHENQSIGRVYQNFVMSCNHCEKPACKEACPVQAIVKRPDGIVIIDRNKCEGITACIMACPFSAIHIASDKQEPKKKESWLIEHPAQKCHMCFERIDAGLKPVCVDACPVYALDCDTDENLKEKYGNPQRLNKENFNYAYSNNDDETTEPNFYIKEGSLLKITKLEK